MTDERSRNQSGVVEEESNEGNQTDGQLRDETQNEDESGNQNEYQGDIPGQERVQDDVENSGENQRDNLGEGEEGRVGKKTSSVKSRKHGKKSDPETRQGDSTQVEEETKEEVAS